MALALSVSAFSQLKTGTIKFSLDLGQTPYSRYVYAPNQLNSTQSITPASTDYVNTNYGLMNMMGAEIKYFVTDDIAAKFFAGGQYSKTPGKAEKIGTASGYPLDPYSEVPTYSYVSETKSHQLFITLGADKYFTRNNVSLYTGVEGGFRYSATSSATPDVAYVGTSAQEVYGFNGAITLGGEYNAPLGLFVGVEIRPFSYNYNVTTISPVQNSSFQASSYTIGYFVFPMLKVGVNF